MKKFILMAAVLTVSVVASAKTWRINPNAAAKPDFTSLKAACDAKKVVKGDTLYCEPGLYTNEDENYITKNCLTILGPGFGFKGAFGSTSTIAEAHFPADERQGPAPAAGGNAGKAPHRTVDVGD